MAVLDIWLKLWLAALIVFLVFVTTAGVLALLGARQIKKVENPVETFRRRVDDHLDWWQNTLLRTERPLDVEPVTVTAVDDDEEGLT